MAAAAARRNGVKAKGEGLVPSRAPVAEVVPGMGIGYAFAMQIIALRALRRFWDKHPQAEVPLQLWYAHASKAEWASPADIKRQFGASVDFIGDNRVIFDLGGNKYRLIVHVAYAYKRALVKFVGTHAEYDKINAETV